jgi:Orsellinic acid/F9775 biosynthesis cluster protein D
MLQKHQVRISKADDQEIKWTAFRDPSQYFTPSALLQPAIPGVAILSGYKCGTCAYYCKSLQHIRKHCQDQHPDAGEAFERSKIQLISMPPIKRYVGVIPPAAIPAAQAVDDAARLMELFEAAQRFEGVPNLPNQISQVFRSLGWDEEDPLGDNRAFLLGDPAEEEAVVVDWCEAFLGNCLDTIMSFDALLRDMVKPNEGGLRKLQNAQTRAEYAKAMTKLILFAMRAATLPDINWMSQELSRPLLHLRELLLLEIGEDNEDSEVENIEGLRQWAMIEILHGILSVRSNLRGVQGQKTLTPTMASLTLQLVVARINS